MIEDDTDRLVSINREGKSEQQTTDDGKVCET